MLSSGAVVGHYEIRSVLGQGGMGVVYLAHDRILRRDVALKVLTEAHAAQRADSLRREAQALAALNHPCIAQVYGFEEFDGLSVLAMEFVDGRDLSTVLKSGPLDFIQAVTFASQIADALIYAHAHRVVHRDLKPLNIRVANDGTVKVLDFGLAQQGLAAPNPTASATDATLSRYIDLGVANGTPGYMSPEQARGLATSTTTDIWAFGVLLFEMLSGSCPFQRADALGTIAAVLEREPDWRSLPESIPASLVDLLRTCLQKLPDDRPQSMAAVKASLATVREAEPASHTVTDAPPEVVERMRNDRAGFLAETHVMVALWSVALADGLREAQEDRLMRLVANLLGLTDVDSALARQKAERE